MQRQISLLSLTILFFLPANIFAQARTDAFTLSISAKQAAGSPFKIKVRGKIENKSGKKVKLYGVSFDFRSRYKTQCTLGDCLSAGYTFQHKKSLKKGESIEFEVDLSDLSWSDPISSTYDFSEPKSSPPLGRGSYYLFMALHLPAENSTKQDPRTIIIKSNEILMNFGSI